MKTENIPQYCIGGILLGAFLGWAVATVLPALHLSQSAGTGWGCLGGLALGVVVGLKRRFR